MGSTCRVMKMIILPKRFDLRIEKLCDIACGVHTTHMAHQRVHNYI